MANHTNVRVWSSAAKQWLTTYKNCFPFYGYLADLAIPWLFILNYNDPRFDVRNLNLVTISLDNDDVDVTCGNNVANDGERLTSPICEKKWAVIDPAGQVCRSTCFCILILEHPFHPFPHDVFFAVFDSNSDEINYSNKSGRCGSTLRPTKL